MRNNLLVKDLSLVIGGTPLLASLSFAVPQGEIVCLAGRNGAGKTTLLRCITHQERRFLGKIEVFGKTTRTEILNYLGVMLNPNALYDYLTGAENLDIMRRYYHLPKERIEETLALVGLSEERNKLVRHYSAGMKQRLSIGIAFLHRPPLIILDEPFNALDPEAIVEARQIIRNLSHEFQTTFLITSHSLADMEKILTKLLILKKGKLVYEASQAELEAEKMQKGKTIEDIYLEVNQ